MIDIQAIEGPLDNQDLELVLDMYREIFSDEPHAGVVQRLQGYPDLLTLIAFGENRLPIGYKIGYQLDYNKYYSWIGGVLPAARNQGIATQLMAAQHDWCRQRGYHYVQTRTLNRWRNMLILNIRHGFDIMGTIFGQDGELRIVLEKKL